MGALGSSLMDNHTNNEKLTVMFSIPFSCHISLYTLSLKRVNKTREFTLSDIKTYNIVVVYTNKQPDQWSRIEKSDNILLPDLLEKCHV